MINKNWSAFEFNSVQCPMYLKSTKTIVFIGFRSVYDFVFINNRKSMFFIFSILKCIVAFLNPLSRRLSEKMKKTSSNLKYIDDQFSYRGMTTTNVQVIINNNKMIKQFSLWQF